MPGPVPRTFSQIEVGTAVATGLGVWATITFAQAFLHIPVVIITEEETDFSAMSKPYLTSVTKTGFDVTTTAPQGSQIINWQAIG
jgi:hypothetical protein